MLDCIANCRKALSKWKKSFVSNSSTRIKQLRDFIEVEGMKLHPDLSLLKKFKWELEDAYREEEIYWKERSKETWLKHGDQNTKFFRGNVKKEGCKTKFFLSLMRREWRCLKKVLKGRLL